jgi:hypothetical protein
VGRDALCAGLARVRSKMLVAVRAIAGGSRSCLFDDPDSVSRVRTCSWEMQRGRPAPSRSARDWDLT